MRYKGKKTMKEIDRNMFEEKEEQPEERKDKSSADFKVVGTHGKSQTVEFMEDGEPVRVIVPTKPSYSKRDLEAGIPASFRWDKLTMKADPKQLAANLHKRDIWTLEDAQKNTRAVLSAIQETYGVDLAAILTAKKDR